MGDSGSREGGGPAGLPSFNRVGLRTLFLKEVRRFSKVWLQTVFSPLITTSLYFLIFGVALGSRLKTIHGIPYVEFVVPGLVMLAMINASFLNTSSSLFQSKINGTTVDFLVAPLGPAELLLGYVGAAMLRGAIVGLLVYAVALVFTGMGAAHPFFTIGFAAAVSASFATFGLFVAVWAEKFDHLAIVPNFVLTPLTFLGGVFYSIDLLPAPWDTISHFNPILYMVNGLRWGFLDQTDVPVLATAGATLFFLVAMVVLVWRVLTTGWRLRT